MLAKSNIVAVQNVVGLINGCYNMLKKTIALSTATPKDTSTCKV
jgi:hypothetical protein